MATLALAVAGQVVGGVLGGPIGATIGRALGALAGNAIDQQLFGGRPQVAPAAADFRLQGSTEGGPIPRLYGWSRLAGNIIWATELEELTSESRGGKGTGGSDDDEQPEIAASFAAAFCEGEVSRLGRVWADGQLLEMSDLNFRFYRGTEAQEADSLIEAKQGDAPGYRGLCYLVFEWLPLSGFGNRIPNITVELCRVVGELEPAIRAITVIPAATEFGYDPVARVRVVGKGITAAENAHLSATVSDWTLSIDELCDLCPNLENVSLVVAWFGDDLRCGHCTIRPKVEAHGRSVKDTSWAVAGLSRDEADAVSSFDGGPAYGGTPSDDAVRAAIADLQHRGLAVTLYPIVLMDIAVGNGLGQPAYPWRGRISCDPAPGAVGTPDQTAAADVQVDAFVGGSSDWGFRRFVRHYASLAHETGCEALILGSELRGMTTLRGAGNSFPFVAALKALAAEAAGLAPGVKLTYGADWSEYFGYQPADAPGDRFFHLDPLWADSHVAAVGIDYYMPLSDRREGDDGSAYGLDGLAAGITGGEGYDWYYASDTDRLAGTRTPISDGLGEPWVWRFKDLVGWWQNEHHDRVGGVRATDPTAWVAHGKQIWLTELGCAAMDKAGNQPNVFPDGKSSENGRPYFSTGAPDPLLQRQVLRAHLGHWSSDANPLDDDGAAMVDPARVYLWTWDARPFPAFPNDGSTWRDASNYAAGHWLTGRLGGAASDELIAAVAADYGVGLHLVEPASPLATGLVVDGTASARDALEPLLAASGLGVVDGTEGLAFTRPRLAADLTLAADEVVTEDAPFVSRRRPDPGDATGRLTLNYADRARDYLGASVTAVRLDDGAAMTRGSNLSLDPGSARGAAEQMLTAAAAEAEVLQFTLPPSQIALEVGDTIALAGQGEGPFRVTEIRDTVGRRVTASAVPPQLRAAIVAEPTRSAPAVVTPVAAPVVVAAQLPPDASDPATSRLLLAAWASPWPGEVRVVDEATRATLAKLTRPATMGELVDPLDAGPLGLWDNRSATVTLYGGHVASVDDGAALAGANRLAVETDGGSWEILGFEAAELIAPGTYRLSRLLRGLSGSDPAMGLTSAGNRVVLLDAAAPPLPVANQWLGGTLSLSAYAGRRDAVGAEVSVSLDTAALLPLPPVHLMARRLPGGDVALGWLRRSRADSDGWALSEVPQDNLPEAYEVAILDGMTVVRILAAAAPAATYAAPDQVADFGSLPDVFDFEVRQLSPLFGPGYAGAGRFDA